MDVVGPHKLKENGTTGKCGFVGVGMAMLEEVCPCGGQALGVPTLKILPISCCLQDIRTLSYYSGTTSACMPPYSHNDDNGLTL